MVESGCLFQINHREKKACYTNIDQMFWSTIWSIFYNNIEQMFWSAFDQYCYKKLFFFLCDLFDWKMFVIRCSTLNTRLNGCFLRYKTHFLPF